MQNKLLARALATMMAATAAVSTASVPMMIAPIVAMAEVAKTTITVQNVEEGATVTAYQLVGGVYAGDKLTKYELASWASGIKVDGTDVTLSDLVDAAKSGEGEGATWTPDNTDVLAAWTAAVAAKAASQTAYNTTWTASGTTYSASVEPGLYLVLITKTDSTTTYSPILMAVNVKDANDVSKTDNLDGSTVDVTKFFENGSTIAYAKKVTNGFKKSIVDSSSGQEKDVKGIAAAVGETVSFKLDDMKLQYYSDKNTTPKYVITDSLEESCFGGISNLKVFVNGSEISASATTYTLKAANGTDDFTAGSSTGYQISFADTFLKANAGQSVKVTYDSKLIATAGQNYAENVNHAQLVYSYINPADSYKIADKTLTDNTYVYTFGIDTNIDKEDSTSDYIDYTLNKVSEKAGKDAFTETTDATQTTVKTKVSPKAITTADAEFTLYSDSTCATQAKYGDGTTVVPVAKADAKGHISFTGLKPGTYYLKETKAPTGYTLSTTVYTITIAATIDDKTGVMSEYSISTSWNDGTAQSGITKVTATADTTEAAGNIPYTATIDASTTPVEIVNTVLQQLPFTGGEGRYAIYIGSVALAALVVVLLIVKRRREEQE